MTTWTQDSVESANWVNDSTILYLLCEDGQNLLDENSDLILIDRKELADWTKDSVASSSWTKVSIH